MIDKPFFQISAELDQNLDLRLPDEKMDSASYEKIKAAFANKKISLDTVQKPDVEKKDERWVVKDVNGKWYRVIKSKKSFDVYEGESRHYTSTVLPTLVSQEHNKDNELAFTLYKEVCSSWRALTDVRFKLLGLVPAVSVVAWGQLISAEMFKKSPGAFAGLIISLIGLLVTAAIRIYDLRNDTLYDDLISRGRKIEEELDVDTGIFLGRRNRPKKWVNHTIPIKVIYGAAMCGWVLMVVWFIFIITKGFSN